MRVTKEALRKKLEDLRAYRKSSEYVLDATSQEFYIIGALRNGRNVSEISKVLRLGINHNISRWIFKRPRLLKIARWHLLPPKAWRRQ